MLLQNNRSPIAHLDYELISKFSKPIGSKLAACIS
jgi:hypothetical protein